MSHTGEIKLGDIWPNDFIFFCMHQKTLGEKKVWIEILVEDFLFRGHLVVCLMGLAFEPSH